MSAKSKSPKLDELSGSFLGAVRESMSPEDLKPYRPKESFEQQYERNMALSVKQTLEGREQQGKTTRRADLLSARIDRQDIDAAIRRGMIHEWADGSLSTLPEWGRIDPNAPAVADFTPLPQSASRPHLHYRGLTKRGNKLWTGERFLCEQAALLANAKLIRTKFRRHGKDGRLWLLVGVNPFNEIFD